MVAELGVGRSDTGADANMFRQEPDTRANGYEKPNALLSGARDTACIPTPLRANHSC